MNAEKFRNWLEYNGKPKKTIQNRISNCRNVECYEGDLDQHYLKDYGLSLLEKLSYSTADERKNMPSKHKIPIDGNIRNGSATLKQATKLYMDFKNENGFDLVISNEKEDPPVLKISPVIFQKKEITKTIKILKVEKVSGSEFKTYWKSPMQKIFIENFEGFYIDTFDIINWKQYENNEIEGVYFKKSSGYNWLQASERGVKIISELPKQIVTSNPNKTTAIMNQQNYIDTSKIIGSNTLKYKIYRFITQLKEILSIYKQFKNKQK